MGQVAVHAVLADNLLEDEHDLFLVGFEELAVCLGVLMLAQGL
jgi:hypothetical protein